MSSKTASAFGSADLAALTKAIEVLAAAQATNNKLVASVLARLASGPASHIADAASAAPTKGKRGRPKSEKEPKVKAAPPAAEDGTIRFGSASEGEYKEFSSFFKAPFKVAGKEYLSLANYFHSAKFAGSDDDFAEDIRTQKNPALTRAKASSVKEHAPIEDWDTEKLAIMRAGLLAKFNAHSALRTKLLATGDAPLESTIDEEMRVKNFWSIGEDGTGANNMGELLMSVRAELADGAPAAKPKPAAPTGKAKALPAPKSKAPAEEEDDSDSDTDDEEEEAAPVAKKPSAVAKPAPPAEEDDDSDSDEDEDEDDE
jgi:ribA/ribD-fused uncharacterized protein